MSSAVPQLLFVRRVLRLAWFVLGAALLGWIIWRNFPPTGVLSAASRTAEPNGFIGGFTPLDRAKPVQENGLWYSDIISEPVYFYVAAPRFYRTMRVRLKYKTESDPQISLGARTDLEEWKFDLKPLKLSPETDAQGWRTGEAEFDLRPLAVSQGRVQMVVSAPAIVKAGGRLRVDSVEIEYVRPPLDAKRLLDLIMKKP